MADFDASLPIRTEAAGDVAVKVVDSTTPAQQLKVDANGAAAVTLQDAAGNEFGSTANPITSTIVDSTSQDPLKVDGQGSAQVTVADASGVAFGTAANPISVAVVASAAVDRVSQYQASAAVAASAVGSNTYTVPATRTLLLKQILASASGKYKVDVRIGTGPSPAVMFTFFGDGASGNLTNLVLPEPVEVTENDIVLVEVTNRANQAQDVYSTIVGSLV